MSSVWKDPATGKPYIVGKPKWPTVQVKNFLDRELRLHEEAAAFKEIDRRIGAEPNRPWWRFRCLITVLLESGLRLGEALVLDDDHLVQQPVLDPATGNAVQALFFELRPEECKSGKGRQVPVTTKVQEFLPLLKMQAAGGRWFPWKRNSTPWYMWDNVRDSLKDAGVDIMDVKLHTLRHTCGTRMRRRGVSLDHIQDWLGHQDISITKERYVHLHSGDLVVGAGMLSNGTIATVSDENSGDGVFREGLVSETKRDKSVTAQFH